MFLSDPPSSHAAISEKSSVFRSFKKSECNLAIWQRPVPFLADELLAGERQNLRIRVAIAGLIPEFCRALRKCGYHPSYAREQLIEDVADIAKLFSLAIGADEIEVRLEIVTTDSCRKFHADYVDARLITTYLGPGTQWIDSMDAKRVKEQRPPRSIHAMKPGDVGLFKGRLATDQPAIHRSPPIAGSGERRLLLVLNSGGLDI